VAVQLQLPSDVKHQGRAAWSTPATSMRRTKDKSQVEPSPIRVKRQTVRANPVVRLKTQGHMFMLASNMAYIDGRLLYLAPKSLIPSAKHTYIFGGT
jgi:hypothetical protein